ncbi:ABC transporter permease [Secundilactobacillus collinoides]|uniref:ABC transporter permease n=1 Tax=Secundilactobacillus collinoides TaxID=33960 RepID=UPI0006D09E4C|nr:ABC transporter permease [Secundilactobacillus collinoides]
MVHGIGLELYKLRSRKDVRLILLVISVFYLVMVGVTAIKPAYFGTKFMVENSFSTLQFIPLIVMVFAADLMSSEFQQGTIKNLIIAAKSRLQIIASKAVALIIVIGLMYLGIFFPGYHCQWCPIPRGVPIDHHEGHISLDLGFGI